MNSDIDACSKEDARESRVIDSSSKSWSLIAGIVILVFYAALLVWLNINHEPWRDEAESWLSARDNGFFESLALARYEGHPRLWHLILAPLAQFGAPIWSMKFVNVAFALVGGYLLIFLAPFHLVIRALILFSYLFSYEYPVLARSYQLSVTLILLLACLHLRRRERPYLYSSVLGLLANTNILGFIVACSVFVSGFLETKERFKWLRTGALPGIGGILFAFFLLIPPFSGGQPLCSSVQFLLPVVEPAIKYAFVPELRLIDHASAPKFPTVEQMVPFMVLVAVSLTAFLVYMRMSRWAQIVLILSWSGLLALFVFKFTGSVRHWGFLAVVLVYSLWITRLESRENSEEKPVFKFAKVWTWTLMVGTLIYSNTTAIGAWINEVQRPFSGAQEIGEFIEGEDSRFNKVPIAGYFSFQCEPVVPFLKRKTIYYPALERFSSNMPWFEGTTFDTISSEVLFERLDKEFGREKKLLLLLSEGCGISSDALAENGFRLIFKNSRAPITSDERFYLYFRE